MATANPAMSEAVYLRAGRAESATNVMTLQGSVIKTAVLLAILLAAATYTWSQATAGATSTAYGLLTVGGIGGFLVAMLTIFRPQSSPITAPIYAGLEGLVLGAISAVFETSYPGIVIQAFGLTIGVLAIMLVLYGTGLVAPPRSSRSGSSPPRERSALSIWWTSSRRSLGGTCRTFTRTAPWASASRSSSWSSRR